MENYVICISALPGKEEAVASFYKEQQAEYEKAKGFIGRKIYMSRPGTMVAELRKVMTPEEMAKHPEPEHHDDGSVHFIIVEEWDSIDDRMAFSATQDKSRAKDLFPNLKPEHTHEYYSDITPG